MLKFNTFFRFLCCLECPGHCSHVVPDVHNKRRLCELDELQNGTSRRVHGGDPLLGIGWWCFLVCLGGKS